MGRIERAIYRSGFVKRPRESRYLPAITFEVADLPEDVVALVEAHLLDLGGTYGVPEAGDPIQHDERRIEHDEGNVEIVVYNRAIPLFTADSEASRAFDSRTGQAILDLLRELNRATQLTVILVTHSPVAASYGHRVVELHDGRIVREGSSPASETAAG